MRKGLKDIQAEGAQGKAHTRMKPREAFRNPQSSEWLKQMIFGGEGWAMRGRNGRESGLRERHGSG